MFEDMDATCGGAPNFFQGAAEMNLFAGEEAGIEPADPAEGLGLAAHEGTGGPAEPAGQRISHHDPKGPEPGQWLIHLHAATQGDETVRIQVLDQGGEQLRGGKGIGVDEQQPIPGGQGSAAVAGAPDLIDGFEDDGGSGLAGDVGGAVGGIIVAHDQLAFPAQAGQALAGPPDMLQGFGQEFLLVEGGNDDG